MAFRTGEEGSCDELLLTYLQEAQALIQKCHQYQHIKGMQKLEKNCRAELKYLQSLSKKSDFIHESQLKSSNLCHFAGILHAMQVIPGVVGLMKAIHSPKRANSLHVDIVAGQGQVWVKVIARKAQALHLIWAGEGQFGEHDLIKQAEDYIACAKSNPVNFCPPTVHFTFYSQVTSPMAEALEVRGVRVWGERVAVDPDIETKLQAVNAIYLDSDEGSEDVTDEESDVTDEGSEESTDNDPPSFTDKDQDTTFAAEKAYPVSDGALPMSHRELPVLDIGLGLPVLDGGLGVSDGGLGESDGVLPVSDGALPVSDGVLPVSDGGLPVSDGALPVSDGGLPVSHRELPVSDGGLPVSKCDYALYKVENSDNTSTMEKGFLQPSRNKNCEDLGQNLSIAKCNSDYVKVPLNSKESSSDICQTESSSSTVHQINSSKHLNHISKTDFSDQVGLKQSHSLSEGSHETKEDLFISCLLISVPKYDISKMMINAERINSDQSVQIGKVNLDITTLITMVSAVTHGGCHLVFPEKILTLQAKDERENPALPQLQRFLNGKELYACQTAWDDFETILNTLGGPEEKKRAHLLLHSVKVIPDQPSKRAQDLPDTGKLRQRTKVIFGTGDALGAVTTTANMGFVRAAEHQGVSFAVHSHPSRALTEDKEKNATLMDDMSAPSSDRRP